MALALTERDTNSDSIKKIHILSEDNGSISTASVPTMLEIKGRPLVRTKSGANVYAFRPYLSKKGMLELFWPDGRVRIIVFEFTVSDSVWNLAHKLDTTKNTKGA